MKIEMSDEQAIRIQLDMYNQLKNKNYQTANELAPKILHDKSLSYAHRQMRKANSKCIIYQLSDIVIYSLSDREKGFFLFDGKNRADVDRAIQETDSRAMQLMKKSTAYKREVKRNKINERS